MRFDEECPTQVLQLHGELLLDLSRLFAKGGEKLPQTLSPLVKSSAALADHYKFDKLLLASKVLRQCSEADDNEYLLMCYEYNRLFVGPTSPVASPYESVHLSPDHLMMGEQTLAVRKIYLQENLYSKGQSSEPDDFIATELEYTAYLISRVIDALITKNDVKVNHYKSLYQDFREQHLSLWLGIFAHTVSQSTKHPVFSALSDILLTLLTLNAPLNTKEAHYETIAT